MAAQRLGRWLCLTLLLRLLRVLRVLRVVRVLRVLRVLPPVLVLVFLEANLRKAPWPV